MVDTTTGIDLKEKLLTDYALQKSALLLDNPMIADFREKAADAFRKSGFPTRKNEEYRYIPMDRFLGNQFNHPLSPPQSGSFQLPDSALIEPNLPTLTLANGFFSAELSSTGKLPASVLAISLAEAILSKNITALSNIGTLSDCGSDPFLALNSAMFSDGLFIHIPANTEVHDTLQIVLTNEASEPIFVMPRILVVAEEGAKANIQLIVPETAHQTESFVNAVTEVNCGRNAQITFTQVTANSSCSAVLYTEAHVHQHGNFSHYSVQLEGKLTRNNLQIVLAEKECTAHLYGYYHPKGDQIFDSHTLVDHRMPHCESNELYKGVVDGKGVAVFNGKVFVRTDAQKTNAYQSNKNILLSEEATVNTKPQLEIYADDVKCSHGSSTGVLDPEQLFYLQSRGIRIPKAKALLLNAYAGEIIENIPSEYLREALIATLENQFVS